MLSQCGVNHSHVEEDLAGLSNLVELADGIVEFVVIVSGQGSHPRFDFLQFWQDILARLIPRKVSGDTSEAGKCVNLPVSTTLRWSLRLNEEWNRREQENSIATAVNLSKEQQKRGNCSGVCKKEEKRDVKWKRKRARM